MINLIWLYNIVYSIINDNTIGMVFIYNVVFTIAWEERSLGVGTSRDVISYLLYRYYGKYIHSIIKNDE